MTAGTTSCAAPASLRGGTVTASLLIARLQAAGAKHPLTRALQEYGRLFKTRFVLGYLADETERRATGRQLNKAKSLHANAVIYWNTIYTQLVLDELPHSPTAAQLAGLTPAIFEHVNALGTYTFNTDRPAGQLRPLRAA